VASKVCFLTDVLWKPNDIQMHFLFALLYVAPSSMTLVSNCSVYDNNNSLCQSAVSSDNLLFCNYVSALNVCVNQVNGCATCFSPSAGVCAADCAAPCASSNCTSAGCSSYYAGWNSTVCFGYGTSGICARNGCVASSTARANVTSYCLSQARVLIASCVSSACRRLDRCVAGSATENVTYEESAQSFYCLPAGSTCGANMQCDENGACVADSICDHIDRVSDCAIVTAPPSNLPCVQTPFDCEAQTGAAVSARNETGCVGLADNSSCIATTCKRNGGNCLWVVFTPSSFMNGGACYCPVDCPPCSSMIGGQCVYSCSTSDGCTAFTCPATRVIPSSTWFKPQMLTEGQTQVIVGLEANNTCACHLPPYGGCGASLTCDSVGACAVKTLCDSAINMTTCLMLPCSWGGTSTVCSWLGGVCVCPGAASSSNVRAAPAVQIPVYVPSDRISTLPCNSTTTCPPLIGIEAAVIQGSDYGGSRATKPCRAGSLINNCTNEAVITVEWCLSCYFDPTPIMSWRFAESATIVGLSMTTDDYPCVPLVFVVQSGVLVHAFDSPLVYSTVGPTGLVRHEFPYPFYNVIQLYLICKPMGNGDIFTLQALRIHGWSASAQFLAGNVSSANSPNPPSVRVNMFCHETNRSCRQSLPLCRRI
jgi:hypothetical protein